MEETRLSFWNSCCTMTPRDRRNERLATGWMLAWMASWLAVNLAISYGVLARGVPGTVAALLPLGLGVRMIQAYRHFLREADELLRKIHLEALAVSFGAGLVGGLMNQLLARTGAMAGVDTIALVALMTASYSLAVLVLMRRFS